MKEKIECAIEELKKIILSSCCLDRFIKADRIYDNKYHIKYQVLEAVAESHFCDGIDYGVLGDSEKLRYKIELSNNETEFKEEDQLLTEFKNWIMHEGNKMDSSEFDWVVYIDYCDRDNHEGICQQCYYKDRCQWYITGGHSWSRYCS